MAFSGFSEDEVHLVPIPGAFFQDLLPKIDHLGELKVTLYAFLLLDRVEGPIRYMLKKDILEAPDLMHGLADQPRQAEQLLEDALERAVARGTLLKGVVPSEDHQETLYFLNSARGRAALHAIDRGEWSYSGDARRPVIIREDVPNIYNLYEQNIGTLTPLMAEELREAEDIYPAEWIEDAIRIAVENNVRNWRYVNAILNRWQEKGRDERKNRRDTEKDRRKYADWEDSE